MSKYKVRFWCDTCVNIHSKREEVIDLIEEGYTEEEAKEIINNEEKLMELFSEWKINNIDEGFCVLNEDD